MDFLLFIVRPLCQLSRFVCRVSGARPAVDCAVITLAVVSALVKRETCGRPSCAELYVLSGRCIGLCSGETRVLPESAGDNIADVAVGGDPSEPIGDGFEVACW